MRELKFRRYDDYEFVFFDLNDFRKYDDTPFVVQNYPIEQYTGLKDKNGKEIYEGDIIHEKWFDCDVNIVQDRIGKVEFFCDSYICWFKGSVVPLGMLRGKSIEIIGNIHENPELLGEEE